jgi:hypothetical protein
LFSYFPPIFLRFGGAPAPELLSIGAFGRALAGPGGGTGARALLKRTYIFVERIPYFTLENILIPSLALEKNSFPI